MTLEEIIEGCRRGNAEARRELYVRYGSPMYGVIRRYVSDASTAEDLLHDGFVTLYTRIGDYRGDGPPTVLDELSAGEIKACVDTLPEGYRTIFNLRAVEEYEYAEIAEMLGISEATTRSQYLRARMKLIEILGRRLHTGTPPRKTDGRGAGR